MDTLHPDDRVGAVVALKALPAAKSRMAAVPAPVRERLARCMAVDTLAALAAVVDQIIVITDQPDLPAVLHRHRLGVRVIAEPPGAYRWIPRTERRSSMAPRSGRLSATVARAHTR
jgi:2-phospho-L-lactate guanylyltransferase (CobY/MobA/RfbA family)